MNRLSFVLLLLSGCWFGDDDDERAKTTTSVGRVVETGTRDRSMRLAYDPRGRVTQATHRLEGVAQAYLYRYGYAGGDPTGNELGDVLVGSIFPGGEAVIKQRDASGAVQRIVARRPSGTVDEIQRGVAFDRHGQITRTRHGNGTRTEVTRDPITERVRFEVTARESDGHVLQAFGYRHDRQGRPTEISDFCRPLGGGDPESGFACCDPATGTCERAPASARFERDRAGRIAKRVALDAGGADGAVSDFAHDAAGNLTLLAGVAQEYNASGRPHAIAKTSAGDQFGYDGSGNVVAITTGTGTINLEWSGRGMPVRSAGPAGSSERSYLGETLWKRVDTTAEGTHVTHFLPELRLEDGVPRRSFGRLAERVTPDAALTFTHQNHLGSSTLITDAAGRPIHRAAFDTYGGAIDLGPAATSSYQARKTFTGKELEAATGLLDFGARLYNPRTGRFVSPDRIVDGLDPYGYANGDPIAAIDPTGHVVQDPKDDLVIKAPATRVPGTDKVPYNCQHPPKFSTCAGGGGPAPSPTPDAKLVQQARPQGTPRPQLPMGPAQPPPVPWGKLALETLGGWDDIEDWALGPALGITEKIAERNLFRTVNGVIEWTPGARQVWRAMPMINRYVGGAIRGVPVLGIAATWANVVLDLSQGEHDKVDIAIVVGSAIIETALDFTPAAPFAGLIGNAITMVGRGIRADLQKGDDSLLRQAARTPIDAGMVVP